MKKPTKKDIISGIQFYIIMHNMIMGFYFNYILIWYKVGLPVRWWSLLGAMMLAFASVFGLCEWITKS